MESPSAEQTKVRPYARDARAREGADDVGIDLGIMPSLANASALELRQFGRACKRVYNRERWRRLNQTRCSILASALHAIEVAMGPRYAGREKHGDKTWVVFGTDDDAAKVAVAEVALMPMRRFDDFREPLVICVKKVSLINSEKLHAWRQWTRETWGQAVARHKAPGWR